MSEFEKLCRDAYYSKRNAFEYQDKYYHIVYLNKRVKGRLVTYAVQAKRVDEHGKYVTVGEPVSVEVTEWQC